jgi:hypothetical protein
MGKIGTVVIPHAFSPRWIQICVASLKTHKNEADFDILVVNNSVGHPSIKALTETRLGEGVKVIEPRDPNIAGHQVALDMAIDLVETPWFIAFESDVQVMRDHWFDWMLSFEKDPYVAIIGWYWSIGIDDWRHYISPAGALYRTSILKNLKAECLSNKDLAVCYGRNMSRRIDLAVEYKDTAGKMIPMGEWGPFLECRGFGNVYPFERDHWVPEPGNWISNRVEMQWEVIRLPGAMVEDAEANSVGLPHRYTYVGPSESEAYFYHHWAGTVSKNFVKHGITENEFMKVPWWLKREYRIWNETVPEDVRKLTMEKGLVFTFEEELAYAKTRVVS